MTHESRPPDLEEEGPPLVVEEVPVLEPGGTVAEVAARGRWKPSGRLGPGATKRATRGKAGPPTTKRATAAKRKPAVKTPPDELEHVKVTQTGRGRFKKVTAVARGWRTDEKVAGRKPRSSQKTHVKGEATKKAARAKRALPRGPGYGEPLATGRASGAKRMGDARAKRPGAPKLPEPPPRRPDPRRAAAKRKAAIRKRAR